MTVVSAGEVGKSRLKGVPFALGLSALLCKQAEFLTWVVIEAATTFPMQICGRSSCRITVHDGVVG